MVARSSPVFAPALAFALAACGGGGGGGGVAGGGGLQIAVDKSSLDFVAAGPGGATQTVNFTLTSGSGTYYAVVVLDRPNTFTTSVYFTGPTTAMATLTTTSPPPGVTTGTVKFRLCPDSLCTSIAWEKALPYTITVFTVSATSVPFQATEGGAAAGQALAISPTDTGHKLAASVLGAAPWLAVARDASDLFQVTASAAGLRAGSYQGQVRVAPVAGGPYTTVPVSFAVQSAAVPPSDQTVTLNLAGSLGGTIPVAFRNGVSAAWTAKTDRAWLGLTAASGTGAGSVAYQIDPAALAGVANWSSDVATVEIDPAGLSPVAMRLTVQKQLPELYMVSPAAIPAGTPTAVHVFGKGLSQLASAGGIAVQGASAAATVTPVAIDGEAVVTVTVPSSGRTVVSVPNPFGIANREVELAVDPVVAWSAVKVANAGEIQSAFYDPLRSAVYAVSQAQNRIVRYELVSGTWQVAMSPVIAQLRDAGLSADRATLFATAGDATYCTGSMLTLDPDTLQTTPARYDLPSVSDCLTGSSRTGLQVTRDARLWFASSQTSSNFTYFDLLAGKFVRHAGSLYLMYAQYWASPDGSKMIVSQANGHYPAFYTAASDSFSAEPPAPIYYGAAASRDGSVFVFDQNGTWCAFATDAWTPLGIPTVAAGTGSGVGYLVSPDGSKVYVLVTAASGYTMVRVDVFDTYTGRLLGQIPLTSQAADCGPSPSLSCSWIPRFLIGPQGDVLFLVGNQGLVVLPIPSGLAGPP
jgi:hypothetical protein